MQNDIFTWMAEPELADLPFCPDIVENNVKEYLSRLEKICNNNTYSIENNLNALVFGEFGHGKTQVLYRVKKTLANLDNVMVLSLIPESLCAKEILRETKKIFISQNKNESAKLIEESYNEIIGLQDGDRQNELLANTLAKACNLVDCLHIVLLIDEATQLGEFDLQKFFEFLNLSFVKIQKQLHTLQCHSLATLDIAKKIAKNLDFLENSVQILLPSISIKDAYHFFRSRILTICPNFDKEKLLSPKISETICEVAGGNPRNMLQLAQRLYENTSEKAPTGEDLINLLSSVANGNNRLFNRNVLKRTVDLLPEEWKPTQFPDLGIHVANYLDNNIANLFAERAEIDNLSLPSKLGVNNSLVLQNNLYKTVGGINVFFNFVNPFGDTSTKLHDDFRKKLSSVATNTGTYDIISFQKDLIINPLKQQNKLVSGFVSSLVAINKFKSLIGNSLVNLVEININVNKSIKIFGIIGNLIIRENPTKTVKTLITVLYNHEITSEMLNAILNGYKSQNWECVLFFYYNSKINLDVWQQQTDYNEFINNLGHKKDTIKFIDFTTDLMVTGNLNINANEEIIDKNTSFYAAMLAMNDLQTTQYPEEIIEYHNFLQSNLDKKLPDFSVFYYVPNSMEQDLLTDKDLWNSGKLLKLNDIKQKYNNFNKNIISVLVDQYVVVDRKVYSLKDVKDWPITKGIIEILKKNNDNGLTVSELNNILQREYPLIGNINCLENFSHFILNELFNIGFVKKDKDLYFFIDIGRTIREKKDACKKSLKECKRIINKLLKFDQDIFSFNNLPAYDLKHKEILNDFLARITKNDSYSIDYINNVFLALEDFKEKVDKSWDYCYNSLILPILSESKRRLDETKAQVSQINLVLRLLINSDEKLNDIEKCYESICNKVPNNNETNEMNDNWYRELKNLNSK